MVAQTSEGILRFFTALAAALAALLTPLGAAAQMPHFLAGREMRRLRGERGGSEQEQGPEKHRQDGPQAHDSPPMFALP